MKKLLLSLAILMGVSVASQAQEVGKYWVGGSLGFNSSKTKGQDAATSYKILPEIGYVLSDNLAVAVSLGYGHSKDNVTDPITGTTVYGVKTDRYGINPFVRYSFLKGDIGGLFVDGGAAYWHSKTAGQKQDDLFVGFRPGVAITLSDRIVLTGKWGEVGYNYSKPKGGDATNKFGVDFDLSNVLLGMAITF